MGNSIVCTTYGDRRTADLFQVHNCKNRVAVVVAAVVQAVVVVVVVVVAVSAVNKRQTKHRKS
jgi:hypothetical protein